MTQDPEKPYHHGDLRAALLAVAEAELTERGVEAFSLRAVAKRAGVSHAAPAHHFVDAGGLLTALAAEGYRQFVATQLQREAVAAPDAASQMVAAGLGYVDFARLRPALFRLMFGSFRPDFADPELSVAARRAFVHLEQGVRACKAGADPQEVAAVWAIAHGLADLMAAGRLHNLASLPEAERDAALTAIISRMLP